MESIAQAHALRVRVGSQLQQLQLAASTVWVDHTGAPVVPPRLAGSVLQQTADATAPSTCHAGDSCATTSSSHGALPTFAAEHSTIHSRYHISSSAVQRSVNLWQRISPGMLPATTVLPLATSAEAYRWPAVNELEPVDLTHHLKRTDFADFTEAKLRHHMQTASAKK